MENRTLKDRWDVLEMGTKFISILCITAAILQLFFSSMIEYLPNEAMKTVDDLELWRLFTSFIVNGSGFAIVFNLPLALYALLLSTPQIVDH
jgi:membrane associated rhomboid family serine protease